MDEKTGLGSSPSVSHAHSVEMKEAVACIDRALVNEYGERCPDFEITCATCQVWRTRDDLIAFLETSAE